jgi:hypothetical protein
VAVVAAVLVWTTVGGDLGTPTGLGATSVGYDSATLTWRSSGPTSQFVIVRDGQEVGRISGGQTEFTDIGLQPDTDYRFTVAAERDGERTPASPEVAVRTLPLPPLSQAALDGTYRVRFRYTSVEGFPMDVGDRATARWTFSPTAGGSASLRGTLPSGADFHMQLRGQGQTYRGNVRAQVSSCGLDPFTATPVRDTLTLTVRLVRGSLQGGAWTADRWVGSIVDDSPSASSGTFYCPAGGWSAAVSGSLT